VIIDGALAARCLGLPHVWHAREILSPQSTYHFLLGRTATLSLINHLSSRIITISRAVHQSLGQGGDASKFVLIYNAINLQDFGTLTSGNAIRQIVNASEEVLLVGEVAGLIPAKGYEDFIEAAAKVHQVVPNTRFVAVGDASHPYYKQKITELIDKLGLQDCFTLLGFRQDIVDVISALDLLVLPSRYEPFGRVLVEAMAAGKPVVATEVGGIPEIVEHGVTGLLVPPGSPDQLAEGIIRVLQDRELARRMGAAGRERAKSCFSTERYVAQIQEVYAELVRERMKK
jgi:glycosyltransferase involved in cell wall biosynthesis